MILLKKKPHFFDFSVGKGFENILLISNILVNRSLARSLGVTMTASGLAVNPDIRGQLRIGTTIPIVCKPVHFSNPANASMIEKFWTSYLKLFTYAEKNQCAIYPHVDYLQRYAQISLFLAIEILQTIRNTFFFEHSCKGFFGVT